MNQLSFLQSIGSGIIDFNLLLLTSRCTRKFMLFKNILCIPLEFKDIFLAQFTLV